MEVRFKPLTGREDQAGGVVWRWRDANNYYVARANALEDNVVAYKVVAGRRIPLLPTGTPPGTYGVQAKVAAATWHTLRVEFQGPDVSVSYDGQRLFAVRTSTFLDTGQVGIWAKADSVTEFDQFREEETSDEPRIVPFSSSVCTARPRAFSPPPTSSGWPPSAASTSPPTRPAPSRTPRSPPGCCAPLLADGVDLGGRKPRGSRAATWPMPRASSRSAATSARPPPAGRAVEQWADVPAVSDELPAARAVIRRHLERLVDECAARSARP